MGQMSRLNLATEKDQMSENGLPLLFYFILDGITFIPESNDTSIRLQSLYLKYDSKDENDQKMILLYTVDKEKSFFFN